MTKLDEMNAKLAVLKTAIQAALDAEDNETAKAKLQEAKTLKERMELQRQLDMEEELDAEAKKNPITPDNSTKENASTIRAIIKAMTGRSITAEEKALLLPTVSSPHGANGEGYILPQDIRTKIDKRIRDFKSFRGVIGTINTTALTGSLPLDDISNITGLVSFADGTTITASEDPNFTPVSWSLKEYGAFIEMSNTLLTMTDNDLEAYIIDYFAKKAVITENSLAITALTTGKTVKTLEDWKDLRSSINKDLDPASLYGTVIATNQDGWDALDSAVDSNGRPILQPDPTQPTVYRFKGYPVLVFSNTLMPSTEPTQTKDGYASIIFGNLQNAAKFVFHKDLSFATSEHAGFLKNTTLARVIELMDCVQYDSSDKCYVVAKIKVADKTGS